MIIYITQSRAFFVLGFSIGTTLFEILRSKRKKEKYNPTVPALMVLSALFCANFMA